MNFYAQVDANKRASFLIMAGFVAFFTAVIWLLTQALGYNSSSVGLAFIISGAMSFGSYYFSDKVVLSLTGAREATRDEFFDYYTTVENLCLSSQTPMPKLYVVEDPGLNAFATGRNPDHAALCATTGLLARLDRTELEGVMAHELSHVRNYDILVMSVVSVLVGVIAMLADWMMRASLWGGQRDRDRDSGGAIAMVLGLFAVIIGPLVANIMKLAISRRREYLADASGAALTKYPEGLARALEKIAAQKQPLQHANQATAHLYIANPFGSMGKKAVALFSTHPPIEERIARLRAMH